MQGTLTLYVYCSSRQSCTATALAVALLLLRFVMQARSVAAQHTSSNDHDLSVSHKHPQTPVLGTCGSTSCQIAFYMHSLALCSLNRTHGHPWMPGFGKAREPSNIKSIAGPEAFISLFDHSLLVIS